MKSNTVTVSLLMQTITTRALNYRSFLLPLDNTKRH